MQTREERLRYAGLVLRNIMRNNIVRSWRLHHVGRLIRLSVALAFIAVALIFYARFAILLDSDRLNVFLNASPSARTSSPGKVVCKEKKNSSRARMRPVGRSVQWS